MDRAFIVKGINPATGRVVELVITAPTQIDAKAQAQSTGLQSVTVSGAAPVRPAEDAKSPVVRAAPPVPAILLVEHHNESRELLARMLELEGYRTLGASNGTDALTILRTRSPSLVIMDHGVPGMSATELMAHMRAESSLVTIPAIVFSAQGTQGMEAAMRAGAAAFVAKASLDWAHLRREIARLVGPGATPGRVPNVPGAQTKGAG